MKEHMKPVLSYLKENMQNSESIFIYNGAKYAFEYYAPIFNFDLDNCIFGVRSRNAPRRYLDQIDEFEKKERMWFLFSHNCRHCKVNEQVYYLDYLDGIGAERLDEFIGSGSSVYLYDLSSSKEYYEQINK